MNKIFPLLFFAIFSVATVSCKKEKAADPVAVDQKRAIHYVASLTPKKLDVDKNFKGTVYFKAIDRSYFIMLDDQYANINLNVINNAIKEEQALKIYMYKGSHEIAKLEW